MSEHTLRREGKVRIRGEAATYLQISLSDQNTASDDSKQSQFPVVLFKIRVCHHTAWRNETEDDEFLIKLLLDEGEGWSNTRTEQLAGELGGAKVTVCAETPVG